MKLNGYVLIGVALCLVLSHARNNSTKRTIGKRTVCGGNDWENAICRDAGGANSYFEQSRVVGSCNSPGGVWNDFGGTGWLIGGQGHFITCSHVFTAHFGVPCNDADAQTMDYYFDCHNPNCGDPVTDGTCPGTATIVATGGTVMSKVNDPIDYCVIQFGTNHANTFGGQLVATDGAAGDEIFIPQHPFGRQRQIAVLDSEMGGAPCTVTSTTASDVFYTCDTANGSSGSPVIRVSDRRAIGLHCNGGCPNRAINMDQIIDDLQDMGTGPPVDTAPFLDRNFPGQSAILWGDPHFVTFDQRNYDYQGVGTHHSVYSPENYFDMQSVFVSSTRWPGASVTQQVGIRHTIKGKHTFVTVHGGFKPSQKEETTPFVTITVNCEKDKRVRIEGHPLPFTSGMIEDDYVKVRYQTSPADEKMWVWISYFSGVTIKIRVKYSIDPADLWLNAEPKLPGSFFNKTRGLLGTWDNNKENDLIPRGSTVPISDPIAFGLSWMAKEGDDDIFCTCEVGGFGDDLFYDVSHVPLRQLPDDTPPENLRLAEELCSNVAHFKDECFFDVAHTGNRAFADEEIFQDCPSRCFGRGICMDKTCQCLEPYYGESCQFIRCPCKNGGTCPSGTDFCSCRYPYYGTLCEKKIVCDKLATYDNARIHSVKLTRDKNGGLTITIVADYLVDAFYVIDSEFWDVRDESRQVDNPRPCENRFINQTTLVGGPFRANFGAAVDANAPYALTGGYLNYRDTGKFWTQSAVDCKTIQYKAYFSGCDLEECKLQDKLYISIVQAVDVNNRDKGYRARVFSYGL